MSQSLYQIRFRVTHQTSKARNVAARTPDEALAKWMGWKEEAGPGLDVEVLAVEPVDGAIAATDPGGLSD